MVNSNIILNKINKSRKSNKPNKSSKPSKPSKSRKPNKLPNKLIKSNKLIKPSKSRKPNNSPNKLIKSSKSPIKSSIKLNKPNKPSKSKSNTKLPWKGWAKISPNRYERIKMLKNCGNKCFLGPDISFPICKKNTCTVDKKGLWAAYIRANEWNSKYPNLPIYQHIILKAKKQLNLK